MQSRKLSLIESVVNIAIGYLVAVLAQIVIFPMFGLQVTIGQNLKIGLCFMVISLVRSYFVRRLFERLGKK